MFQIVSTLFGINAEFRFYETRFLVFCKPIKSIRNILRIKLLPKLWKTIYFTDLDQFSNQERN